jgi:predicted HTH domain antitoxin
MTLRIEDDLSRFFEDPARQPEENARELIVLKLFRERRLSEGKAAELLAMTRLEFIQKAGQLGIPYFNLSEEEFEREMETVGKLIAKRSR